MGGAACGGTDAQPVSRSESAAPTARAKRFERSAPTGPTGGRACGPVGGGERPKSRVRGEFRIQLAHPEIQLVCRVVHPVWIRCMTLAQDAADERGNPLVARGHRRMLVEDFRAAIPPPGASESGMLRCIDEGCRLPRGERSQFFTPTRRLLARGRSEPSLLMHLAHCCRCRSRSRPRPTRRDRRRAASRTQRAPVHRSRCGLCG
jgi:hypothetical protein